MIENTSYETKESIQEYLRKDRIGYESYAKPSYSDGRSKSLFISLLGGSRRHFFDLPVLRPVAVGSCKAAVLDGVIQRSMVRHSCLRLQRSCHCSFTPSPLPGSPGPAIFELPASFETGGHMMVAGIKAAHREGWLDHEWHFAGAGCEVREIIALAYDMIAMIDDCIARILATARPPRFCRQNRCALHVEPWPSHGRSRHKAEEPDAFSGGCCRRCSGGDSAAASPSCWRHSAATTPALQPDTSAWGQMSAQSAALPGLPRTDPSARMSRRPQEAVLRRGSRSAGATR